MQRIYYAQLERSNVHEFIIEPSHSSLIGKLSGVQICGLYTAFTCAVLCCTWRPIFCGVHQSERLVCSSQTPKVISSLGVIILNSISCIQPSKWITNSCASLSLALRQLHTIEQSVEQSRTFPPDSVRIISGTPYGLRFHMMFETCSWQCVVRTFGTLMQPQHSTRHMVPDDKHVKLVVTIIIMFIPI